VTPDDRPTIDASRPQRQDTRLRIAVIHRVVFARCPHIGSQLLDPDF
jgi:hypothetical protein